MHRIIFLISYPFLMGLSLLPFPIFYLFSDFMYFLVYRVFKYRTKVVRKNLSLAFPEKSAKERKAIERKFYRHMCDVFLEMIKTITISEKEMKKRFVFENIELIRDFEKKGKSSILTCGHYSSWEGMLSIGYHLNEKAYGVYNKLSNPHFERLIKKSRERHHAYLLPRYETVQTIQQHHKNGHIALYGFANDQSPKLRSKSYWRTFMGVKVPVFTGAERIAKEHDLPVTFAAITRVKRGHYKASISLLTEDPKSLKENELTDLFTEKLEAQIKKDPSQYLWTHNRFKYKDKAPIQA